MRNIKPSEVVLITGATGTLGTELISQLTQTGARIRGFSRDEAKQADLRRRFPSVDFILGDVRDPRACRAAVQGVDVVIHAASLKYVDVSELQPTEYALTNVLGTINMIAAVNHEPSVRRMVGISTDKACAPFNTYGLTKGLLEKFFMEAHQNRRGENQTEYTVARYGNVLGSRGSVVPIWAEARKTGKPIKVTDPTMTRFFFTIADAVTLIDISLEASGGSIIAKMMPAATLKDLALVMAEGEVGSLPPVPVEIIGRRPGEKPHEDLLSAHEMWRTSRIADFFFYHPLGEPLLPPLLPAYTSAVARQLSLRELRSMVSPWL